MKQLTYVYRSFGWALLLVFTLTTAGCASRIKGWSEESFRSEEFNPGMLQNESVALLPVIILSHAPEMPVDPERKTPSAPYTPELSDTDTTDGSILSAGEAYHVILNEILTGKIQTRSPGFNLMPPGDVLIRLNDENLACNYSRFARGYTKLGLTADQLKCFGDTLNSRYLFINQAAVFEHKSEASLTIVWTFGRKSVIRSVKIYGQLWDTLQGKQIWEGSGVGFYRLSAYEGPPLFEQMASVAVDRLLSNFAR